MNLLSRAAVQFASGLEFGAQFVEAVDDDADENQGEDDRESGAALFGFFDDGGDGSGSADNRCLRGIRAAILQRATCVRDVGISGGSQLGAATVDAKSKRGARPRGD